MFVLTIIATVSIMYNILNCFYKDDLYPTIKKTVENVIYTDEVEVFYVEAGDVIRENLFFILMVILGLCIVSTFVYIKDKSKTIAFVMYTGGSDREGLMFLFYTTLRSFFKGCILGIITGILISPIYSKVAYMIMGSSGKIMEINPRVIEEVSLFLVIEFFAMLVINYGYIYRESAMGLMQNSGSKKSKDGRVFKIHYSIYIILYLLPVFFAATMVREAGSFEVSVLLGYLSAVLMYPICKYSLDGIFKMVKKFKFMYKGLRIIYISNGIASIKKSATHVMITLISVVYLLDFMVDVINYDGMAGNLIFCTLSLSLIISVSFAYKLIVESDDSIKRGKQMELMGYSKKEIVECIKKEKRVTILISIVLPMIIISAIAMTCVTTRAIKVSIALKFIVAIGVFPILSGVVVTLICVSKMKREIKGMKGEVIYG